MSKYVHKGPDCATALVTGNLEYELNEEIKRYLDTRYIPFTRRTNCYLSRESGDLRALTNARRSKRTMLIEWFIANQKHPHTTNL